MIEKRPCPVEGLHCLRYLLHSRTIYAVLNHGAGLPIITICLSAKSLSAYATNDSYYSSPIVIVVVLVVVEVDVDVT